MSEEDSALRGETAQLIKELGLTDYQFDDDAFDSKNGKNKQTQNRTKASSKEKEKATNKPAKTKSTPEVKLKVNTIEKKVDKLLKTTKTTTVQKSTPPAVSSPVRSSGKKNVAEHKAIQPKQVPAKGSSTKAATGGVTKGAMPVWLSGKGRPVDVQLAENGQWYDALKLATETGRPPRVDPALLSSISDIVQDKFEAEVTRYLEQGSDKNDADSKWMREVIQSGTLSDRVAALAIQVQKSPVHHLRALDTLMDMCCKKEQRVAQLAIEATKDLLIHNLLPDRPLVPFLSRNLFAPDMNMNVALLCWYEGELIHRVARFVGALEAGTMVNADYFKKICLDVSADLLVSKPEQEARYLALIVNKLGDPSSPICQRSMELLKRVVHAHPAMTPVVVREVRNFVSRPHLAIRALFSSILFLSQIPLRNDSVVAAQLVECYVSLFEKAVQREESGSRLLYALLTGINRAFPFLKEKGPILQHLDALFRIVHSAAFTTSTQALMLISYIALVDENAPKKSKGGEKSDDSEHSLITRFYRALYDKLLNSELPTRARNTLFLNLLFRSMKRDPSPERIMAFVKRLMICVTQCSSNIAAGFIFLIAEVCRHRPEVLQMVTAIEVLPGKPITENDAIHAFGNFNVEKREPQYAVPLGTAPGLWEVSLMRQHFHPSVKAFTNSWLSPPNHSIKFDGDPITEFSISAFLNRFSYKNPKTRNMDKVHRPLPKAEDPVNSEMFVGAPEDSISPDKAFFHKYFGARIRLLGEGKLKDKSHRKKEDSDDEGGPDVDGNADEFELATADDEAEIDKYADTLAEQMIKSFEGNKYNQADIDDEFNFSSDSDSSAESGSAAVDDDDNDADLFKEEVLDSAGSVSDDASDFEGEILDSDDMDGEDTFEENMSDIVDDVVHAKGAANKRKKSEMDVFASADDYEEDMEEIMKIVSSKPEDKGGESDKNRKCKKQKTEKDSVVAAVDKRYTNEKSTGKHKNNKTK